MRGESFLPLTNCGNREGWKAGAVWGGYPDLPIFQRLSILLITLLKFDLFVSMMRDNTDSGSGYRVCMVMTERLVDIFRFQV